MRLYTVRVLIATSFKSPAADVSFADPIHFKPISILIDSDSFKTPSEFRPDSASFSLRVNSESIQSQFTVNLELQNINISFNRFNRFSSIYNFDLNVYICRICSINFKRTGYRRWLIFICCWKYLQSFQNISGEIRKLG